MLKNSYIHIPYVGYITERKIWNSGVKSWKDFDKVKLPSFRKKHIKKFVDLSIECLSKGNYSFFSSLMPKHEHWRCLEAFSKVAYLDIETTGLDKENDDITLIGVYDGSKVKSFVRGEDFLKFKDYISSFPMIVTFNGSCFDLPFITSKLGIKFDQLHVDLRFAFSKLGITGGLKRIEKMFELERSAETKGLDGFDAVTLWHKYVNGDDSSLDLLKRYNAEDVIGLKILGKRAYGMLKRELVG
ncbi:MAG: ribonuclease H-like domain-containing protein [Nanoarchaeota archaeon]|nr:ribonuclease H-like domain-containing protein [Nanoarchaeota archaeon]